jgi:hypothetical protein
MWKAVRRPADLLDVIDDISTTVSLSAPTSFSQSTIMSLDKAIKLSSGVALPLIGLGTWDSKPGEVEQAVEVGPLRPLRHDCLTWY